MDSRRNRRTRDEARKAWYDYYRYVRFTRWFVFLEPDATPKLSLRHTSSPAVSTSSTADR